MNAGVVLRRITKIPLALEAAAELIFAAITTRQPEHRYFQTYGLAPIDRPPPEGDERLKRLALTVGRMVARVARLAPTRAVCLQQALATHRMLRRRGHKTAVMFGVARPDGTGASDGLDANDADIVAHAWVEAHGVIANGARADLDRFAVVGLYG